MDNVSATQLAAVLRWAAVVIGVAGAAGILVLVRFDGPGSDLLRNSIILLAAFGLPVIALLLTANAFDGARHGPDES